MSNIEIKEISCKEYGKCIKLTNGDVEVVVTVDMGPRIIKYNLPKKENIFCNNTEQVYEKTGWKILGGHRLWMAPEHEVLSYEPDNSPIEYEIKEDSLHVLGNPGKTTGLRKEMFIKIDENGTNVLVRHRITNNNLWAVEFAPWALSVMASGGKEVIPINKEDTGFLGNCWLGLWPYTKMNDHRIWWGDKYITLSQDINEESKFKLGMTNPLGWAAYFNNNMVFIKKFQYCACNKYPDNNLNFATFTNGFILEIERMGALTMIASGDKCEHVELWTIIDDVKCPEDNDGSIDETLDSFSFSGCGCDDDNSDGCGCSDDKDGCCSNDQDDCCNENDGDCRC